MVQRLVLDVRLPLWYNTCIRSIFRELTEKVNVIMIQITDKTKCCGCTACVSVCPQNCITMQTDDEGFSYPVVNPDLCIGCDACEAVCPC